MILSFLVVIVSNLFHLVQEAVKKNIAMIIKIWTIDDQCFFPGGLRPLSIFNKPLFLYDYSFILFGLLGGVHFKLVNLRVSSDKADSNFE